MGPDGTLELHTAADNDGGRGGEATATAVHVAFEPVTCCLFSHLIISE